MQYVLVCGGSGGIGSAFVRHFLSQPNTFVFATFYSQPQRLAEWQLQYSDRLLPLALDITEEVQIAQIVEKIKTQTDRLHYAINCIGFLQTEGIQPEKNLRSLQSENLVRYFQVNSIGAVLLAKHLLPLFKHEDRSVFATLSAKVGSIGDNYLGGWYGYRASKAALNMFMRSAALEYQRTCPNTIVVLLHPGTTDTELSRPFQTNVPPHKLFSPHRSVAYLTQVLDQLQPYHTGTFWSWDGSQLPW
ncbi:MAG: SDR family NAD(P)-dependent oxidoreductase [Pseudanabaenaceae cyanobacterium SKYGB_i_bin29]|nr:SDR family NAD(P)-dependent oxidoreductase [Pseudanabaenaceae cyanobacterium SKYG29]MDW8421897.1 SDR family NAD(P)-dependent oxidoreductase [Pseudanabaenaceae cyanobacterium SKYGB_i_bin29]